MSNLSWNPLFEKYRVSLEKSTEACDEYHYYSLLAVLGCLINKMVSTPYGRPTYPNFMVVLVGESAIARKTTAQRFASNLMSRIADKSGVKINVMSGLSSAEGLLRHLGAYTPGEPARNGTPTLASIEEFASLLRKARQDSVGNLPPVITEVYDLPNKMILPRVKNPLVVDHPFLCMLAGTTPAWLESSLEEEEVLGGFCNRFLFCVGEPKQAIASPKEPNYFAWDEIADSMSDIIGFWRGKGFCKLTLSEDAEVLWEAYYSDWRRKPIRGILANLRERIPEYVRKIALLMAFLDKSSEISVSHIETATEAGAYAEESLFAVFGALSPGDKEGRCEKKILVLLEQKGRMKKRELQQWVSHYGSAKVFSIAIDALRKTGQIGVNEDQDGKEWVYYIPA